MKATPEMIAAAWRVFAPNLYGRIRTFAAGPEFKEAIQAALDLADGGWRPIETAPKDGEFLTFDNGNMTHWSAVSFWQAKAGVGPMAFAKEEVDSVSDWRPLPAPPTKEGN